jgi:hypothetical protein
LLDENAVLYEANKDPKEEDSLTKPQREVAEDIYRPSLPGSDSDESDEYGDGDSDVDSDGNGYSADNVLAAKIHQIEDDPNSVHVGLRVYTHKDVQVEITSTLLGDD